MFYEPFDPTYLRELVDEVLEPILEDWFRPRLIGAGRLPQRGPAILAVNHSGNAFPYDAMILDAVLWRHGGYRGEELYRTAYEKELSLTWWMRPFGLDNFWRRGGGVDVTFDNFDRLLGRGDRVVFYPEGVPGIGKGFHRRYRLQPFKTSFVLLAARHRCPVWPVYTVNAEWIIPFNFTIPWIDRVMDRTFGVPFLPLPGALFAIVFPWAWYLALPARVTYVVGEPLDVAALVREAGIDDLARPDRERLRRVADSVRARMQAGLDRCVERFGRRPYHARLLARRLWRERRRLHRSLPPAWPFLFHRYERDRRRPPARNGVHRWLRDWDLVGFHLPFGWPFLSLTRALRKPPCGYRGMSRDERRELRGEFVWRLRERPLPPRRGIETATGSGSRTPC